MAVDIGLDAVIQELDESQQKKAYKADDPGYVPRQDRAYNVSQPQGQPQASAAYTVSQSYLSPAHMDPVGSICKTGHKGICTESKY